MDDIKAISVYDETIEDSVDSEEMTVEEKKAFYRENEDAILEGLFAAIDYTEGEDSYKEIKIVRGTKEYFSFRIKPLTEEEYQEIRKRNTKFVKNKSTGMKIPGEINAVKYRSEIIYRATHPEDRKKIWDNKKAWDRANVVRGIDFIDVLLLAGEKDMICDKIDEISGYVNTNLEEVAKN